MGRKPKQDVTEPKKRTVFDWMKSVMYGKEPWNSFSDEDKETFNAYMLNRFLSMYEPYIELVNSIQQLWLLTPEQIYNIYCEYLPKKNIYAAYVKSNVPKINSELLEILSSHFKVSKRETKQYINILEKEDIENILRSRGIEDKKIKEIVK